MEVLPAIDLRGGRVVRLAQGDYDRQTTYADDAAAVAAEFASAGARWIHVVDLDAARTGRRTNAAAIEAVCRTSDVQVELGGGIRSDEDVRAALNLGVDRVIIGSAALKNWTWFADLARRDEMAGRVVLGLDARAGELAGQGWTEPSGRTVDQVAARAAELPLAAVIYTDIDRDGMFTGPDLETCTKLMGWTNLPVIASGGVSGPSDVAASRRAGCAGVIIGRAYYEGRIDLAEACRLAGMHE
jgi:phosphoribosylformimino-5-aminoimidazole carboxamide ribotide isomerase